jgi:uncharacterized protein (TIGR02391 family)
MQANETINTTYQILYMTKKQLQEIENIIDIASSGSLQVSMNRALTFALSTENEELSHWLECELSGYLEGNQTYIDNPKNVPTYRKVVGMFMDDNDRTLQQYYNDVEEYNFYYLREGISELETLSNETSMISIQKSQAFEHMSKQFSVPITRFVFSPITIHSILQAIRNKLIKEFIEIKKQYRTELGFLSKKDSSKFLQSLHPTIQLIATQYFEDEHYRSAILDTYIGLIQAVKDKSNIKDKDGSPLMDFVFSPNKPILKVSDDKDEQQGAMWLFKGAVMYVRNANAHKLTQWEDAQKALEWLSMASALFYTVQESQVVCYE